MVSEMNITKYEKMKANQSITHMQTSVYKMFCEYVSTLNDAAKCSLFYDLDRELRQYIMSLPPLTPFGDRLQAKLEQIVEVAFYLYPQYDVSTYKLNMVDTISKMYVKYIRDVNKTDIPAILKQCEKIEALASTYYNKELELNNRIEKEKSNLAFSEIEHLTEAERALAASTAGEIYVKYMNDVHAKVASQNKQPIPFNPNCFENLYPKGLRKAIEVYTRMLISATHPHLL